MIGSYKLKLLIIWREVILKKEEYNYLKVITILLVVFGHSTYYIIKTNFGGIDYFNLIQNHYSLLVMKLLNTLPKIIYYFHMPLFMAISGAFFQIQIQKNKWKDLTSLLRAKFKRLMIPFLVFTLFYTIPIKYISNYFVQTNVINAIIGQLFLLGNSHLWYLYALFVIFILAYYVLKRYSGFWMLVFLFLLHLISYKIELTLIKAPLQFLFYFAMGFMFESKREVYNKFLNSKRKFLSFLVIGFVVLILFNFGITKYSNLFSKIILEILAIYGSLLTYTIAYYLSKSTTLVNTKIYQLILINGLGIYIFSDTLNYLILYCAYIFGGDFMFTSYGIILLVIIRFIGTLFLGIGLTIVFKKIFPKYQWLVN